MSLFSKNNNQDDLNKQNQLLADFLNLGHLVKYNFYLLAKAIVFNAVAGKVKNLEMAAQKTNEIIGELDLDTKAKLQQLAQQAKDLNEETKK